MTDYCSLCGSPIGENNPDGLGSECRKAINEAKFKAVFSIDGNSLKYNHIISADITRFYFLDSFKDTKFRTQFNKDFYESMKNSERISKKQIEIMQSKLFQKDVYIEMFDKIKEAKQKFINDEMKKIVLTRDQIEIARRSIRK